MEELIDIHLNNGLYVASKILNKDYDIYYSDIIDDEYWNFAYIKNNNINLNKIFIDIKNKMEKLNRDPIVYITSNMMNESLEKQIENSRLQIMYTDVWMILENFEQFELYKSKIDFSLDIVNEYSKEKFIQAIMDGFAGNNPEDPYNDLSDGYRIALNKSFLINQKEYKILHYLGTFENDAISTATVIYKGRNAIIYNVTTNKKYQRQGICKKMMSEIISNLNKLGVETVCLQTEQGFYTEQVYKSMGFKEVMLGKAYMEE